MLYLQGNCALNLLRLILLVLLMPSLAFAIEEQIRTYRSARSMGMGNRPHRWLAAVGDHVLLCSADSDMVLLNGCPERALGA